MYRLGQAYLACGEQTAQVELLLRRIASAYGMRRSRVVTFPTAIFISFHDNAVERVTLAEGPTESLRLDQIADVYELGGAAQRAAVTPGEGRERLTAILKKPARFGALGFIIGHMILTVGLAMVFEPPMSNLVAAALLGAVVGVLKALNRNQPVLAVPLSVVAAALVSSIVFFAFKKGLPVDPLHALVPPLVTFLPGGMLTLGMVELAYGDMISGTSRVITGFIQLVLLAFGLAAGAALVGYEPSDLLASTWKAVPAPWMPWVGVAVFGTGAYLHFSARGSSFPWMVLVLFVAFATQNAASGFLGPEAGGFFGMLVATPLGYLIQLKFKGPPAMVTFLPSFWLLVPGAMGLVSVTQMLTDRVAGVDGLTTVVFALTSIALGTLLGASLYRWLTETFGWWQLQLGRVGSSFRLRRKK